jgi:hypothetical protein
MAGILGHPGLGGPGGFLIDDDFMRKALQK